jgi:hypothetical protein
MTKIVCNTFVKRQTAESPFSFFADMPPCPTHPDGRTAAWGSLEAHIEECVDEPLKLDAVIKDGYKPGVKVVTIPGAAFGSHGFYSGVVAVTEKTPLMARFAARREGEAPFMEVLAQGPKLPAEVVDIILYSRELLIAEGEPGDPTADYEIVSINARSSLAPEPMTPMAMARNFLGLAGGTKAEYTAQQFADAIVFWSQHAMRGA